MNYESERYWQDQVAIVTGGGNGIGRSIVEKLAGAGSSVAIVDVDGRAAYDVASSIGDKQALSVAADVSSPTDVESVIARTVGKFGKVSILVNCAAVSGPSVPAVQLTFDDWSRVLSVILNGSFLCSRAFSLQVVAQGASGKILNVGSTVVERPRLNSSAYCVGKSGLVGLTRVLAMELAKDRINVNAVSPGMTLTEAVIERKSEEYKEAFSRLVPKGRPGYPNEIADAALYLLSPAADYITGQTLYVDGGYTAGNLSVDG